MVKRSFFARLFGRSDSAQVTEPEEIIPRRSPQKGMPAKGRMPDIDFDEPAPKKEHAAQGNGGGNGNGNGKHGNATATATKAPPKVTPPPAPAPEVKSPPTAVVGEPIELDKNRAPAAQPAVQVTEMPRNEELTLKLQEGFTGLSSVLRGIDTKIDQQQKTSEELIVSVRKLPDLIKDMPDASRAGLELLNTISSILEYQGRSTSELLAKMRELPGNLEAMEHRFQEQVTAVARASQDADRVAKETQQRLTSSFEGVKRAVEDVQVTAARRQDGLVEELKRVQAAQEARVDDLLKRMGSSTRIVIFLMIVTVAALLIAVYGMQR
jgi:hypothetical protein